MRLQVINQTAQNLPNDTYKQIKFRAIFSAKNHRISKENNKATYSMLNKRPT